jgi:hypothetical protein
VGMRKSSCGRLDVIMEGRGFGSWVHHMVGALTHTFSAGLTLLPRFPYDYFLHDGCPVRTHSQMEVEDASCYFEPVVSNIAPEWVEGDQEASSSPSKLSDFWQAYLPPQAISQSYGPAAGILWWNTALVNYIMSPNRRLLMMKNRYKNMLGWPSEGDGRIIGVHIRHGDACADWRRGGKVLIS